MSIIIHFNTTPFISAAAVPSTPPCLSKATATVEMVSGIEHTDGPVMTDDESSMVDIATSDTLYTHALKEGKSAANHGLGSCFGLPYQDHNYGAPPPPTPPSYSPCASPLHANGVPDEDTNLSVVSTSTTNEETQEGSITRCICGFEHDDEYMICCDLCLVWQHVDCMGLDRSNIPETYLCEKCEPRKVDRHKAKVLQTRKKVAMTGTTKQDTPVTNQFFGKDYKKKALLQTSEWTCQKIDFQEDSTSTVHRIYYTSDSEEESTNKGIEYKPKTRSKRRKKEDKNEEKADQTTLKRNKSVKHCKERMEIKHSKLRRTKDKESTSTADEEAQDAWEYNLEWCEQNFETAMTNQYTSEIQQISRTLITQGDEKQCFEQLQSRQPCRVVEGNKLICVHDTPREQPLIEYKGKFLLASQFLEIHPVFTKRLYPYVLFYTLYQEEICVDASVYGNDARFVRRSCKPNAEMRHFLYNGNLHLYISSTKAIFKDDEITIPLDLNPKDSFKDIECACESDDCILKFSKKNGGNEVCQEKKKKGRRATSSADDDSSHSFAGVSSSKLKSAGKNTSIVHQVNTPVPTQADEQMALKGSSDHETEEQANKKKMTREERKIDAIMRAFDQMEKAERRRQQALERQKSHHPKPEDIPEKLDNIIAVKEEEIIPHTSETVDEEKPSLVSTPKPKKGKRRRGSGTPSRRRTRTNSGGSDILTPEEAVLPKNTPVAASLPILNADNVQTSTVMTPGNLPVVNSVTAPLPAPSSTLPSSPVMLKTKRFLLHEWLQEKSEAPINTPVTSPLSIHTEMTWSMSSAAPTCYVRCTKDNPHSSGISSAHLRRSSSSGPIKALSLKSDSGQGSAKKRWLRQAMYDCNSYEEQLTIDPGTMDGLPSLLESDCFSPSCHHHGDISNPGVVPDDVITPLKKRRLMRESIESMSSPMSPPVTTCMEFPSSTVSSSLCSELISESGMEFDNQQLLCVVKCDSLSLSPQKIENSSCKINGLRMGVVEFRETEYKKEPDVAGNLSSASISLANTSFGENFSCSESSVCKTGPSVETNCDLESKINGDIEHENVQVCNLLNSSQNNSSKPGMLLKTEIISFDASTSSNSQTQFNILTEDNAVSERVNELVTDISNSNACISDNNNTKKENSFAQMQNHELCPIVPVNNISNLVKSDTCTFVNLAVATSSSEVIMSSVTEEGHLSSKTIESPDNNVSIKSFSKIGSVNICESTKQCMTNLTSDASEQSSFISHNSDNIHQPSIVNHKQESVVSDDNSSLCSPLNQTAPRTTCSSEEVCINTIPFNSLSADNKSPASEKSSELYEAEQKSSIITNENLPNTARTTCASATQKRKVSLSEYRMRMRESASRQSSNSDVMKKNMSVSASATAIPETLPEQVSLAPLPLFDTTIHSRSPTKPVEKNLKKKKELLRDTEEECKSDVEHRENLTERLKREFGFSDDSEGNTVINTASNQMKSICTLQASTNSNVPILPLCAQPPPPPPPPPPPRPLRPSPSVISGAAAVSPSQFSYPVVPPYPRPSFIVAQVPGTQYISSQPPLPTTVLPPVHQISPVGAQCNVQLPLLPSTHSFTSLPGTVLRPQHEFASVNAQNFVALVQQPPPPPPPHKTYPHVYQPSLYK